MKNTLLLLATSLLALPSSALATDDEDPRVWLRLELGIQSVKFDYMTWDGVYNGLQTDQQHSSIAPQVTLGVLFDSSVPFWSLGANLGVSRQEMYLEAATGTLNVPIPGGTASFDKTVEGDLNADIVTLELVNLFHFDIGGFRGGLLAGPGLMTVQTELWRREYVSGPGMQNVVEQTSSALRIYPYMRLGIEPSYLIAGVVRVGVYAGVEVLFSEPDLLYRSTDIWHEEPDGQGGTVMVTDSQGAVSLEFLQPLLQGGLMVSVPF
ncbi:MAG: hypothetical protein JRI25_16500 [Deltaproteobacteria bacterium]|nr:hypothetical protein [Deltaproteobacteria bacterium]